MPLLFVLLLLIPSGTFAQSGSSVELGNSTFHNIGGISRSSQSIGDMDFYSSSTPSLSGSTTTLGDITFGTLRDGTSSAHQSIVGMTFHTFSKGGAVRVISSAPSPSRTATSLPGDKPPLLLVG